FALFKSDLEFLYEINRVSKVELENASEKTILDKLNGCLEKQTYKISYLKQTQFGFSLIGFPENGLIVKVLNTKSPHIKSLEKLQKYYISTPCKSSFIPILKMFLPDVIEKIIYGYFLESELLLILHNLIAKEIKLFQISHKDAVYFE